MSKQASVVRDIAQVDRWLAQPDCGFEELRVELDFLESVPHTRRFLIAMREGLEDVRDGRVMSNEEFERRRAQQRQRFLRPDAAE